MTTTVIVITLKRPDYIRRCLQCLFAQTLKSDQIIVVDASPDDLTLEVVKEFENVVYLRNPNNIGRMTTSRNIGLKHAFGDIIAFVDDDAFAAPEWLANIVSTYTDPTIGAVGGQALNNQPGELERGVDEIGRLYPDGSIAGYFAADPGKIIEVDHIMGCNMSFRKEVIAQLGGFREDYPGISGKSEDTDMSVRVKKLGYKILFNPEASVLHLGAPQLKGQRFDLRYTFFSERNHICMLMNNFGWRSSIFRKYLVFSAKEVAINYINKLRNPINSSNNRSIKAIIKSNLRNILAANARLAFTLAGAVTGLWFGAGLERKNKLDPVRHDPDGQLIAKALRENKPSAFIKI